MQPDLVGYLLPTLPMTPRWNNKQKRTNILHHPAVCFQPGLTHGRHVVHVYSVSPFGIMYDNSADASPQLAFTISCYTLSPSIPTCNRSTCACTCGSNTRTQRHKHKNTQTHKQTSKHASKQTNKHTNKQT